MLKTRILTALVLLACFIPALFFLPHLLWAVLMLVLTLLAIHEWAGLVGIRAKAAYTGLAAILGFATIYAINRLGFHSFLPMAMQMFLVAGVFWAIIVPLWLALGWRIKQPLVLGMLGVLLLGALWLAMICAQRINPWLLLVIISTIWIADSAAYFSGKQFGKHKLAVTISPGKTWEGVFGALLFVGLFGLLIWALKGFDSLLIIPGLCALAIAGVYGDLFESMLKRQANIKDSGHLLPGHGGVLDRIDGVMPAMPLGIVLLYLYQYLVSA